MNLHPFVDPLTGKMLKTETEVDESIDMLLWVIDYLAGRTGHDKSKAIHEAVDAYGAYLNENQK